MNLRSLLLLACSALAAGCASPSFQTADAQPAAGGLVLDSEAPRAAIDRRAESADSFRFAGYGLDSFADSDGDGLPDTRLPEHDAARKLIREAHLGIQVANVEESIAQLSEAVEALGGYVAARDGGLLSYRVPAEQFETAAEQARGLGRVHHESMQVQDVTEDYRDAGIRLENARRARDRLIALLDAAEAVEDILKIEKELQRLTAEIESLEARLQNLDLRIALSLLQVEFSPLPEATPQGGRTRPSRFPWIRAVGVDRVLARR